jgi:arylsulfatase A-like enzyme
MRRWPSLLVILAACGGTKESAPPVVVPATPVITLTPSAPYTTDDLVVTVEGDASDLTFAWYRDDALQADLVSSVVPAAETAKGQSWRVVVSAPGARGEDGVAEASTVILNSLPTVTVAVAPPEPGTDDALSAAAEASDADGDAVVVSYAWAVDGADAGITDPEVAAASTERGQSWAVTATPNDGEANGEPVVSAPVVIGNTAPSVASVGLEPGVVFEESVVSCVPAGVVDVDGDAATVRYAWLVNGVDVGVAEATLTGASFSRGDGVGCVVTPGDGTTDGAPVASPVVVVENTVPVVGSVTISPESPREGDVVSATIDGALDVDGDPLTFAYAWYVDGALVSTAETLTGADFDKGQAIVVEVTPADGSDVGAGVVSSAVMVVNTPPSIDALGFVTTDVYTNDTAQAVVTTSDPDPADTVVVSYAWTVDGVAAGGVSSSLAGAWFAKHAVVSVTAAPFDGTEAGAAAVASLTVLNSPPTAPEVIVDPDDPLVGTADLVCTVVTEATDPDGDPITYRMGWDVDGSPYAGSGTTFETGDTVDKDAFAAGETWTCSGLAYDGEAEGPPGTDATTITDEVFRWTGPRPTNLLVISLDTTRRDHIGRFSGLDTTPFLDARLAEAVVLEDHRSCSSWTYPSTTCVQTGLFPPKHGWWPGSFSGAIPEQPWGTPTLQEALSVAGYETGLTTSNDYISPWYPHGDGFDLVSWQSWLPAEYVMSGGLGLATRFSREADPWYLHMHFFDPHAEYDPPYPYDQGGADLQSIPWDMTDYYGLWGAAGAWWGLSSFHRDLVIDHVDALYTGELQYWDSVLEETWVALDDMGMLDDTLVVFWTDHGEQWMERGAGFGHGLNLFAEENRSTAAFWAKNLEHRAVPLPTIHTDISPTILDILGVPPVAPMDGRVLDDITMDRARMAFLVWDWSYAELMVEKEKRQLNYWWNGSVSYHDNEADPFNYVEAYDLGDPDVVELTEEMDAYIGEVQVTLPGLGAPIVPW